MNRFLIYVAVCFVAMLCCVSVLRANAKRPLQPEDLLNLEAVGTVELGTNTPQTAFSPDGGWVAYVLIRPKASAKSFQQLGFQELEHADVWLAATARGKNRNLTDGAADGAGFWSPKWSPDGERLAMLSTRGENLRLWIWTRASAKLELVSEAAVDDWAGFEWISGRELVFVKLPSQERPRSMTLWKQAAEIATREWPKAWKGSEPTASVLESGIKPSLEGRSHEELVIIDVLSGKERSVSSGLAFRDIVISPDRKLIAFLRQVGVWQPMAGHPIRLKTELFELGIVDPQEPSTLFLKGVDGVLWDSVVWSPDGTELGVIGYDPNSPTGEDHENVFRCTLVDGKCRPASAEPLDLVLYKRNYVTRPVQQFVWVGQHDLLIFGIRQDDQHEKVKKGEAQWWRVKEEGQLESFGRQNGAVPSQLLALKDGTGSIATIKGKIWRLGADGQALEELAARLESGVASVEWPYPGEPVGSQLILAVKAGSESDLYRLDLVSEQVAPLEKPSADATLAAFDVNRGICLFSQNDPTGTYLWLSHVGERGFHKVVETNTFLKEIAQGELRKIEYRSLDGEDLKGWVILPPGYEAGRRWPVVVWNYPSRMYGDDPPHRSTQINDIVVPALNLQLLAAHGYVVLLPSMPLPPFGEISDPYLELTKGVLPAVDKLIDLVIADPERVGLMGHSFGGYGTYGLITQTHRFKVAVSLAGPADLLSGYGIFNARSRYQSHAYEYPLEVWNNEYGLGVLPWEDLNRYLRNSPISYVDRVHTPLMIMQGDMDSVPIEAGEEFFTALYRQNKRARFVRYWGEWHWNDSPANIRDMWQRIYAWLDEYLEASP